MIVEDFVMLGKTVPEPTSDGRVFVCSAGVSASLGSLIRVYPLARRGAPRRWSINQVRLERNPKDSRQESWKLTGDRAPGAHEDINVGFEELGTVQPADRPHLLAQHVVESVQEANARRMSLAIIHPAYTPRLTFDYNPDSPDSPELRLFDDGRRHVTEGHRRFVYIPRLDFHDAAGPHSLTLRDWGCFEFLRKHGDERRYELAAAMRLGPKSSLLVGNLNHRRNAWLVISVLNGCRPTETTSTPSLFEVA